MDQPPSLLTMPSLFSIDKFATASSLPSPLNATVNSTALQDLPNTSFNSLGMVPQMGWVRLAFSFVLPVDPPLTADLIK